METITKSNYIKSILENIAEAIIDDTDIEFPIYHIDSDITDKDNFAVIELDTLQSGGDFSSWDNGEVISTITINYLNSNISELLSGTQKILSCLKTNDTLFDSYNMGIFGGNSGFQILPAYFIRDSKKIPAKTIRFRVISM